MKMPYCSSEDGKKQSFYIFQNIYKEHSVGKPE
jgi:hypothetical protein